MEIPRDGLTDSEYKMRVLVEQELRKNKDYDGIHAWSPFSEFVTRVQQKPPVKIQREIPKEWEKVLAAVRIKKSLVYTPCLWSDSDSDHSDSSPKDFDHGGKSDK